MGAFSSARTLVALARPKGTILLLAVPLTGYGFAHWDYGLSAQRPLALAAVLAAWMLLSAASLWLNSSLDGEEGGVLFAPATMRDRPAHLTSFAHAALVCAVGLSFAASIASGVACTVAAALAILYSHPRTMWKARPVLGPLVNGLGYGVLSWIAGFGVARVAMSLRTAVAMALITIFIVGMCFAAQAYQRSDDERRGYRTLVVTRGPAACLRVASACTRVALAGVFVLAAAGVYPRLVLLGAPAFVFAELTMARWRRTPDDARGPTIAAEFALRMLAGGVVLVSLAALDAFL